MAIHEIPLQNCLVYLIAYKIVNPTQTYELRFYKI